MRTQKLFISDETFYEICRPNFDLRGHLTLEEDKIKIVWIPGKKKTQQEGISLHILSVTIIYL